MAKFFQRALDLLTGNNSYDEDLDNDGYYDDDDEIERVEHKPGRRSSKNDVDKIVRIHNENHMEIVIISPEIVEDGTYIVDYLHQNKSCIVNLEGVEWEHAQRIIDFLSGAAFAVSGDIQRVSNDIFIIAPDNVSISGKLKEDLKANGYILTKMPSSF